MVALGAALGDAASRVGTYAEDNRTTLAVVGGVTAVGAVAYLARRKSRQGPKVKPGTLELGTGNVARDEVKGEVAAYYDEYNTLARGEGMVMKNSQKVAAFVDKFYSLVTDLYEWGWGQSFHFSPMLPGRDWSGCEAAHETRIGTLAGLRPGKRGLDVGCGVGGPMRTIAAATGAHVTGVTINEYQVRRAQYHNRRAGLEALCEPVRGNFLDMPFAAETFDGAYAIEATCHANKLENVYGEVFRVLKPGSRFATYEWVTTPLYDAGNVEHVKLVDEIIVGNGLPAMRTWKQAEEAGESVGFRLLESRDLALNDVDQVPAWWLRAGVLAMAQPNVPEGYTINPWYARLGRSRKLFTFFAHVNAGLVWVAEKLRVAPKGMVEIHDMLMATAYALIDGGELGIFTPMHLLVFEKPAVGAAAEE